MTSKSLLLALVAAGALSGCASSVIEKNGTFIDRYAQSNVGASAVWHKNSRARASAREATDALLEQPITADAAVKIALIQSAAFQVMMSEAAAMSATATQSARLSNPIFTFERLVRREGSAIDLDIGRMLSVSLLEFIYLPSQLKVAENRQEQARLRGAAAVVETATNARQAWVRAVAAEQSVRYFTEVMEAAEASAELARRMYSVGNFSRLQRARQQAFYADAAAQLTRARQTATANREALVRVLGLDFELAAKLKLPERLPDIPKAIRPEKDVAQLAIDQRLDIRMATTELGMLAIKYGVSQATSYVNAFHIAGVRNSETGKPPQRGFELELAIPVFDWGDAQRAQAHATYFAALNRLLQVSLDAESLTREQYAALKASHEIASHYRNEIVPLRKVIADEMLLKYNGMLTGVFDLLAETRAQIGSVIQAIDAERDYWLADAALQATLLGKPSASIRIDATAEMAAGAPGH
jgi:outer membrane protein TolC